MVRRGVFFVVLALILGSGVGLAQSNNCTIVGTWMHSAGPADLFTWNLVATPGASATAGQLDYEWVLVNPTLPNAKFPDGMFPNAVRATNPNGAWEKVKQGEYNLTWVAYGLDKDGKIVYVLRPHGVATMTTCDTFSFIGTYDVFLPTQDIWSGTPVGSLPVNEPHWRMPVVVR
jgi:hypothetical protein